MVAFDDRETVENIARNFTKLLRSEMNIKGVYLYGSAARGGAHADSDIDIAVVGDDFIGDPVEDRFKLMKLRRKVDTRIEPHPFRSSEFDKSNPFVKEILSTGIKIF